VNLGEKQQFSQCGHTHSKVRCCSLGETLPKYAMQVIEISRSFSAIRAITSIAKSSPNVKFADLHRLTVITRKVKTIIVF